MKTALCALALSLTAFAALAQPLTPPPALKAPLSQGLTLHTSFAGPSGLTGWVLLKGGGDPIIVFTTADGKTVMSGALFDDAGRNLVAGYLEAHAPKADYSTFAVRLSKAAAILQGDAEGKNVVYAFFDPTCPYCSAAYTLLRTSLRPGTQVRWIPVAFLAQKSAGQAAALLTAADSSAALAHHEALFKSGGVPAVEVSTDVRQALAANLKLFRSMGFTGVPALLYRTADGRLDVVKGAPGPTDLPKLLAGGR